MNKEVLLSFLNYKGVFIEINKVKKSSEFPINYFEIINYTKSELNEINRYNIVA